MTATLIPMTGENRPIREASRDERDQERRPADCTAHGRLRDRLCERCGDSICSGCVGSRIDGICRRCLSRPAFESPRPRLVAVALRGGIFAAMLGPMHAFLLDQFAATDMSLMVEASVAIGVLSGVAGLLFAPVLFGISRVSKRLGEARHGPAELTWPGLIGALAGLTGAAIIGGVFDLGQYISDGSLPILYLLFATFQLAATLMLARGKARELASTLGVDDQRLAAGMTRTIALGAVVGALTPALVILGCFGAFGEIPTAAGLALSFPIGAITGMVIATTLPATWFDPTTA